MLLYDAHSRAPQVSVDRSPISIPRLDKGHVTIEGPHRSESPALHTDRPSRTAYRLPRLRLDDVSEREQETGGTPNKLWGRHGYDYYNDRNTQLSIMSSRTCPSPRLVTMDASRANHIASSSPKFERAMISPTHPSKRRLYAGNVNDPAMLRYMVTRTRVNLFQNLYPGHLDGVNEGRDPLPTPVPPRIHSPPKSARSIQWTLSPMKNLHYDKKSGRNIRVSHDMMQQGGKKAQGPYSREFAITCATPNSWLRMKLGRSRTTMM